MRLDRALVCIALLAFTAVSVGAQGQSTSAGRFAAGEIIVKFRPGVAASARGQAHRQAGGASRARIARTGAELVSVRPGSEQAAIALYQRNPNVLLAEPNFIRTIPKPASHSSGEVVPNDYYFYEQYGLHNTGQGVQCFDWGTFGRFCFYTSTPEADVDAPEGWAISTGSSAVRVAVIDSGIDYNHPDLAPNYIGGYDFLNNDPDPMDDHGHGTHVAGTIAAAMNNPTGDPAKEEGVVGVAPNARILSYKVCGPDGHCDDFGIQLAIARAITDGAKVINMSLGSTDVSLSLNDAVQDAWAAGLVIVAGAGNDNSTAYFYPAAFDNVVGVGAFDEDHKRASFSNYGPWVDIAAPGNVIMSTFPLAACAGAAPVPGDTGCYNWSSGTSMATPHVSGAVALLWSRSDLTTNAQVVDALQQGADRVGVAPERLDFWTIYGGLNLHGALSYAVANRAPTASAGGPYSGLAGQGVAFDGSGSNDPDGDALVFAWNFGDGSTGSTQTPTHVYLEPGTYTVTLTVDDQQGGTHSASTTATIIRPNRAPVANAGADRTVIDADATGAESVVLDGTASSDPDGDLVSYRWSEGGTDIATGATPTVSLAVGSHTLVLTVRDSHGLQSSDTVVVTVQVAPDSVSIAKATYTMKQRQLAVEAMSSRAPQVTLTVYDATNEASQPQIGTLVYNAKRGRYVGTFTWPSRPTRIRVASSGGGSATAAVTLR